jgi:hypothetical protein
VFLSKIPERHGIVVLFNIPFIQVLLDQWPSLSNTS